MPVTRSRHKKTKAKDKVASDNETKQKPQSSDTNTTGLAALPADILLEIIQYIPGFDRLPDYCHGILSGKYANRSESLLALSQTSRWLRKIVSPFVWRRFEVCASSLLDERYGMESTYYASNGAWHKELATNLVRQIEIVTVRDTIKAQQVREVCIALSMFSATRVYKEFVRFLTCLPNIHTLHILYVPRKCEEHFKNAFSKASASYPTVRTALLHPCARHILPYLSGIRSLHFVGKEYPLYVWRVDPSSVEVVRDIVDKVNPDLRVLNLGSPFFFARPYLHEIDFSKFTKLVEYPIRVSLSYDWEILFAHVKTFKSLRVIHFNAEELSFRTSISLNELRQRLIDELIHDQDAKKRWQFKIWYRDDSHENFTNWYGTRCENLDI